MRNDGPKPTIRSTPLLANRLKNFCKENGLNESEVIRVAIVRFLNEVEVKH